MINYLAPKILSYNEILRERYPQIFTDTLDIKTITFQVTENCCLKCTYCYQEHNSNNDMTFETAKLFIDKLLSNQIQSITTENTKAIIVDFIGGEPFMKIDLIIEITDYLFNRMFELKHPWLNFIKISISSNGILYFDQKVQDYLRKYAIFISLGISLDGFKQLHDSCRIDLQGNGSYDRVIAAVRHYKSVYNDMPGMKMTFSPNNINYLYKSCLSMIDEGYTELQGNCIFEEGWTYEHASILYYQLKQLADYLIDNDLYNKIYVSFFEENDFVPMDEQDNNNWCGGTDSGMLALDYKGDLYRCIRYMETSLQGEQPPLIIGDIRNDIGVLPEHKKTLALMDNITRRSQSTDECFYCPIARGCAWCSGYNYQKTGTPNKRVTYICVMHKARALANVYYWNKLYKKLNIPKTFINNLPKEQSLLIVPQEELNILETLQEG